MKGKTLRYAFTSGPTAGQTYEHTFHSDGTVSWRSLDASGAPEKADTGTPAERAEYGAFELSQSLWLVSYRANSGYTLTLSLNFNTRQIFGFASNEREWHALKGTLEET